MSVKFGLIEIKLSCIGHDNYSRINFINDHKILKIGYFDKIAERKGLAILKYLDQNKPNYIELNIYTADKNISPHP